MTSEVESGSSRSQPVLAQTAIGDVSLAAAQVAFIASRHKLQVPEHLKGILYSPRDLLEHNIALQMEGVPAIPTSGQGPSLEAIRAFRTRRAALKMGAE